MKAGGTSTPGAIGIVLTQGRGDLPSAVLHGSTLQALAANALREAGITVAAPGLPWRELSRRGSTVVLADALCPLVPSAFLREALAASTPGGVVVAVQPVTDTIANLVGERIGPTQDRDSLRSLASPTVLPADVAAALPDLELGGSPEAMHAFLIERYPVRMLPAPPLARRVEDYSALRLLAASAGLGTADPGGADLGNADLGAADVDTPDPTGT